MAIGSLAPASPYRRSLTSRSDQAVVAVGYLRRSTDRQEQSIPDQRRAVEAYAIAHGMRLGHCYTDDAVSGTSTIGRKAFQQMMADAQGADRPFAAVVVYDVKRFGRVDNDEAGYYRHLLKAVGVAVHYASENFNGDGTDDLLRPVKQWQARQESKDLSKVTIRGLLTRSTTGCWMGGAPPYGYDLRYESQAGQFLVRVRYEADGSRLALDDDGNVLRLLERGASLAVTRRDRCKLVPGHVARAGVVKRIFSMYVDGRGFKAIASTLNVEGLPAARGPGWAIRCNGLWSMSSVRSILVNPAYCGDMAWNRRTDARFHRIENGHAVERHSTPGRRLDDNLRADWVVVKDAHEALVPRNVWETAQRALSNRPESKAQRGTNPRVPRPAHVPTSGPRARFLLSGLVTCGRCRSRYEGISQRLKTKDAEGKRNKSYFYACGGAIRKGPTVCSFGQVSQQVLEDAVVRAVLKYYGPYRGKGGEQRVRATLDKLVGTERRRATKDLAALEKELESLDATVRNLVDNLTAANRTFVDARLNGLTIDREEIVGKIKYVRALAVSDAVLDETAIEAHHFILQLPEVLRHVELSRRLAGLRKCISGIQLSADNHDGDVSIHALPTITSFALPDHADTLAITIGS